MVHVLPFIARQPCFAVKGGTAINLFVRELPRLSVDIDLVYLPLKNREEALQEIRQALDVVGADLEQNLKDIGISKAYELKQDALRLIVLRDGVRIKVELSPVLRGTVFGSQLRKVCAKVEDEFGFVEVPVVAFADLYAGKICAALDRQHPRDLFDIKLLIENEGLTEKLRQTLLVYLLSHNRPITELLRPKFKNIRSIYEGEFTNMTEKEVSLDDLLAARVHLVELIHQGLTASENFFLLSFENREPNWKLLDIKGIGQLPAIKWKQMNLAKMADDKHKLEIEKLKRLLAV